MKQSPWNRVLNWTMMNKTDGWIRTASVSPDRSGAGYTV
ncbi:hypothetical protein SAMN05216167_102225 [Spirosoma endophyticum]|uniref:Uncharacterized protein n=1 Tax=Spirosoma endophyticum TaxID=662367 RepID=A0A1I1LF93_9BACT|nr:hypothetical protein SAMN05216167_102225 [Spirosoma endophyticum]